MPASVVAVMDRIATLTLAEDGAFVEIALSMPVQNQLCTFQRKHKPP